MTLSGTQDWTQTAPLLPNKIMVPFIMGVDKQSKLYPPCRRLDMPSSASHQWPSAGISSHPILFNIYTYDLPDTDSKKIVYADDICLGIRGKQAEEISSTLSKDMDTLFSYFKKWRLILSEKKRFCLFHLSNKLATMLDVYVEERPLPFASVPTYLGVKMERSLTYHHHLESLKMKVASRVALIRKLTGTTWGADAATAHICLSISVFNCWILRSCVVPQFPHSHAGLWIESCRAHHNRLPQKYAYSHAICPRKCGTPINTQRCSGLEIYLESPCRPTELATWRNCYTSQELPRAAASNQKISQIKPGPSAGCRAKTSL